MALTTGGWVVGAVTDVGEAWAPLLWAATVVVIGDGTFLRVRLTR